MNTKEIVVRIIQPAEQPKPRLAEFMPTDFEEEKNPLQTIINAAGLAAIAGLGLYFGVSFFHLGFSFNDVLIILGIPVAVGAIVSYVVL